jgi:hypothetical protein
LYSLVWSWKGPEVRRKKKKKLKGYERVIVSEGDEKGKPGTAISGIIAQKGGP